MCGQDESNTPESVSGSEGADGSSRRLNVFDANAEQNRAERPTVSIDFEFRVRVKKQRVEEIKGDATANTAEACGGGGVSKSLKPHSAPLVDSDGKATLISPPTRGHCFLLLR